MTLLIVLGPLAYCAIASILWGVVSTRLTYEVDRALFGIGCVVWPFMILIGALLGTMHGCARFGEWAVRRATTRKPKLPKARVVR